MNKGKATDRRPKTSKKIMKEAEDQIKKPLRVLIVEDLEEDALLLVRELKRGGYDPTFERVETAESMKAALSAKTWDLVLADYSLPHFSGLKALEILKESGLDLPSIIVSGTIGEDVAVEAMKAGAHDYIMKDRLKPLVPAIEQELREAEVRRKLKESENALHESEKRYRRVVENATEIIYTVDEKGNFTYANPAGLKVTGYSLGELQRLNYADLVLPEHRERVSQIYINQFREKLPTTYVEFPFLGKAGEIIWFGQNSTLIIEDGRVVGFHIIARDITERKKAEEALRESEERYRILVETSPDAITLLDLNLNIIIANQPALKLYGYESAEEVKGKNGLDYLVLEERGRAIEDMRKMFETGSIGPIEYTLVKKDGTPFSAELKASLVLDSQKKPTGIILVSRDITDRRRAEEALRSEKAWSEAIVSLAPNIVVGLGKGSKILIFNKFAEKLTGFRAEEVMGKPWLEIFIPEEMRGQLYGVWDEIVKNKLVEHHYENTIATKQGDRRVISWSNTVLTQDGEFRMVLSIGDDITERKQAEEAVKESEERYRNLFENAIDGIALADSETGILIDCNKAIENLVNRERAELIGQSQKILHPPEDNIGEVSRSFAEHRFDKKGQLLETQVITKAGERKHVEIKANIIELKGGRVLQGIFRDITERKQAEEALRESEKRYRSLFDRMPIGLYRTNSKGEILDANPALVTMLGYSDWESLSKVEVVDTDVDPEERKRWLTLMEQEGIVHSFQRQLRRRDGSVIWVEENARVFRNAESEGLNYYEGSFQNITERKQGEEALRQAEERYRSIFENAVEGIFQTTPEGRYLSANPAQARILGYESPEELVTSVTDIANQLFAEPGRREEVVRLLKEDGVVREFEFQAYRKDGSKIWILSNVRAVRDATGVVIYHEGIIQDITDRKRAQESLKQSEENARRLAQENAIMAEIARIISSTLDIDEVYERFTEEVKKIISFDRIVINMIDTEKGTVKNAYIAGEGVGDRNVEEIYPLEGSGNAEMVRTKSTLLIQTEDFKEYKNRFPMLLSTFQAGFRSIMNVPLFSKGKIIGGLLLRSRKPYAYTDKDVRLAERIGSQIAGAIANAQLYTEHLRAEEEKTALQEQLRQSQKMEAIGRLAGGVAHDFNNLLTIIKGNSELSLMDVKEDDPLRGNLEGVLRASGRASDLIRQLLAFSRRQILEMKVVDLNSLLTDLDKMLHRLIGEDVELVTLLTKDSGRVKVDSGQIEQVILNLAVNSRDAMPSGGRLTIETANVELDEEYTRSHIAVIPGRYIMLSVSDTGVGMTPEVRDKVFEPFFTTKESGKGTGLGLSTVYGIVKQSGGNIWVYSEPGKGTTFKIYLPRVDEPLGEVVREKAAEERLPRGSETILIVEDDEDVREVAVRILKMQGYRVLETSQGSDALHHCEHEAGPIHLMVTDVVMPAMNGPELAKRLNPLRPETKVLYISGYTDNAIVRHGVLEKGVNYIQKPFTVEGLARKVREVLDQ